MGGTRRERKSWKEFFLPAISYTQSNMSQIVPDFCELSVVVGQAQGSLETGEYHVVLLRVEATEAYVGK